MVILSGGEQNIARVLTCLGDADRVASSRLRPTDDLAKAVPLLLAHVPAIGVALTLVAEHLHLTVRSSSDLTNDFSLEVLHGGEINFVSLPSFGLSHRFTLVLILLKLIPSLLPHTVCGENLDRLILAGHNQVASPALREIPNRPRQLQHLLHLAGCRAPDSDSAVVATSS